MIYVALFLLGQAGTGWALWLAARERADAAAAREAADAAAATERSRLLAVILSLESGRTTHAIEVAAEGAGLAPSAPREPREPEYSFINGTR